MTAARLDPKLRLRRWPGSVDVSVVARVLLVAHLWAAMAAPAPSFATAGPIVVPSSFVELIPGTGLRVDLKYSTPDNFTGVDLYGDFNTAYLHPRAASRLDRAVSELQRVRPGFSIVVFDALRPRSIQRRLWAVVAGTPKEPYVAHPSRGSIHNYGFAVDVGLADAGGRLLDMGTEFDSFSPLSQPRLESRHLRKGLLTKQHIENRRLLRSVMVHAGFRVLSVEWWHFDAEDPKLVRQHEPIVE
jgi:D-alanyl-D-alanine dipeptidase